MALEQTAEVIHDGTLPPRNLDHTELLQPVCPRNAENELPVNDHLEGFKVLAAAWIQTLAKPARSIYGYQKAAVTAAAQDTKRVERKLPMLTSLIPLALIVTTPIAVFAIVLGLMVMVLFAKIVLQANS